VDRRRSLSPRRYGNAMSNSKLPIAFGESPVPLGVPSSVGANGPCSTTPAFSHFSTSPRCRRRPALRRKRYTNDTSRWIGRQGARQPRSSPLTTAYTHVCILSSSSRSANNGGGRALNPPKVCRCLVQRGALSIAPPRSHGGSWGMPVGSPRLEENRTCTSS
jgi:hypothetical protein